MTIEKMKEYIADSFAEELFTGNPAAVVPCPEMPEPELMQKIAVENNYSETAFVVKKADGEYDLKWFTPGSEINLCGHATLATAFVLHEYADKGVTNMRFHTLSGDLLVTAAEDGYVMDFPVGKTKPIPVTPDILSATNGLAKEAYYDDGDMVVIVDNASDVASFIPNSDLIRELPGLGLILTAEAEEENCDFVSRCFYPKLDVLEDPVTGRAHTYLAPVWAEKLGTKEFFARQISPRGGAMKVEWKGERVYLTGKVQLFMEGELSL